MTEQLTVEQMNREIAEFMGGEYRTVWIGGEECQRFYMPNSHITEYVQSFQGDLPYHSSWDSLMPVWFKIQDIGADIGYQFIKYHQAFHAGIDYKSIDKCYKAVYDFITWYKTQGNA